MLPNKAFDLWQFVRFTYCTCREQKSKCVIFIKNILDLINSYTIYKPFVFFYKINFFYKKKKNPKNDIAQSNVCLGTSFFMNQGL